MPSPSILYRYACRIYPSGRHCRFKRARFLARALLGWPIYRQWLSFLETPVLKDLAERDPSFYARIHRSALFRGLTPWERLRVLKEHHSEVIGLPEPFGENVYSEQGFGVASVREDGILHEFKLRHMTGLSREGEMTLCWFADGRLIYSLTFVLCKLRQGRPTILIGGIQGLRDENAQEIFRDLTKRMHGLRPASTLLHVMRALAEAWRKSTILAVGDRAHALNHKRAAGDIQSRYDDIWLSNGAVACENGLFELPIEASEKTPEQIPTRKRAQYRRRYALMAGIASEVRESFARLSAPTLQ